MTLLSRMLAALAIGAALAAAPVAAQTPAALKAAVEDKWACIGANTSEGNPAQARYAKVKGCISDFAAPCDDVDANDSTAQIACYKREEAIWEGIIGDHLIADAKAGAAQKPGIVQSMSAAASAMRLSRDKTCSFVNRFEVNVRPPRQYYCRLTRTAEFAMLVYLALYTP